VNPILAAAAAYAALAGQLHEPAVSGSGPAAASGLVLRAGTPVPLVTSADLSSRTARQGQRFDLAVASDVLVDGMVVIPKATRATGEVARIVEKGMFGKAGKLEVRILFLELAGRRIRLDGGTGEKGESGLGVSAVAVVLVGALGGFVTGKSAVIPAGTSFSGYIYEDLPLKRARAP
jgi:hypothetical protein